MNVYLQTLAPVRSDRADRTLIAEAAVARGHRPVLAGRDPQRLRRLAEQLDLNWVAGPASEMAGLIGDANLVLLAAGPFGATAPAVLRACLDAGVHYIDIANEIPVASAALAADDEARRRGITVLPAIGFGTVASDGLARYVADQVPGTIHLDLAILLGTDGSSAGAKVSTMRALAAGGRIRHDGRLVRTRLGAGARRQQTPIGGLTLVPVPSGDLVVTGHTTGIVDITVSFPVPCHRSPPSSRCRRYPSWPGCRASCPNEPRHWCPQPRNRPRCTAICGRGRQPPTAGPRRRGYAPAKATRTRPVRRS